MSICNNEQKRKSCVMSVLRLNKSCMLLKKHCVSCIVCPVRSEKKEYVPQKFLFVIMSKKKKFEKVVSWVFCVLARVALCLKKTSCVMMSLFFFFDEPKKKCCS